MNKTFKIRKGLDIRIKGQAEIKIAGEINSAIFALRPDDFKGITPKLKLKEDEIVKRGEIVFFDKYNPQLTFASPVAGKIKEIVRGEKRKILEILIEKSGDDAIKFDIIPQLFSEKKIAQQFLSETGLISFITQRPYGIVANPEDLPRDIFVNFFDSAPLAPDYEFILKEKDAELKKALEFISVLTDGKVYCNLKKSSSFANIIPNTGKTEINYFEGPHPSGLAGTHINKIKPLNKGEIVWTIDAADLAIFGHLLINGEYLPERLIAVTGSVIKSPAYYKIVAGADMSSIKGEFNIAEDFRIISGNVLTGTDITKSPYLGIKDSMISVIPEGNKYEMFGWVLPGFKKFSNSGTFLSGILPIGKFELDTNLHGGHRAYVVTGEYEKVCPLDIYPQLLIKAILANDIDKMEQMGIYEVIEEDLALCEFVCTSKNDIQEVLRDGLDLLRKEMA
ncbi:MAG: Na(+)-translocating NADH-quinone reductase subunit A [Bacteroidales bacterium]|nr:Na(+)-translocating NADH-quinone reductase subunit A [Bacteroidales bacterium]